MTSKKEICLILNILIIFLCINLSMGYSGTRPNLNPKVEVCIDNINDCFSKDLEIMNQGSISLKVTITNKDYAISCINEGIIYFDFYKFPYTPDSYKNTITNKYILAKRLCLPINTQQTVYIPIESYNNISSDSRNGKWVVENVKLNYNSLECYSSLKNMSDDYYNNFCQTQYSDNKVFVGDKRIEINVSGSSPSLHWYKNVGSYWRNILIGLNAIFAIIGSLLLGAGLVSSGSKRRNFLLWGVILLIVVLVLFGYGFYN